MKKLPKRIIEVDLPIARISAHARREKFIRHGHISTLHIWWARRPLAACRAVILASLWPDPEDLLAWASRGDEIPVGDGTVKVRPNRFLKEARQRMQLWAEIGLTKVSQETYSRLVSIQRDPSLLHEPKELRAVLLDFIADFADWDHSTDRDYLEVARGLTQAAHEALGGEPSTRPMVIDPFAGGGSIPLEALRIGADTFASDLNPIPVLLNKVVLEYIPKYGKRLADEVRTWGHWIKNEAERELVQFYPPQKLKLEAYQPQPKESITRQADGRTWYLDDVEHETPIVYLWARTVLSEAPGKGDIPVEVPLMRSLWLAKKSSRKQALRWVRDEEGKIKTKTVEVMSYENGEPLVRRVKRPLLEIFRPKKDGEVEGGTVARGNATCPVTGHITRVELVRSQLKRRRGGASDARLFAVVTTLTTKRYVGRKERFQDWDEQGRFYRLPTKGDEEGFAAAAEELCKRQKQQTVGEPSIVPDEVISLNELRRISVPLYGMERWGDLFSPRQALALSTLARLVREVGQRMAGGQSAESALDETGAGAARTRGSAVQIPGATATPVHSRRAEGHSSRTERQADRIGGEATRPQEQMARSGTDAMHKRAGAATAGAQGMFAGASFPPEKESTGAGYPPGLVEAIQTCLALAVSKGSDLCNSLTRWKGDAECPVNLFGRQAVPMVWEFAEAVPTAESSGSFSSMLERTAQGIDSALFPCDAPGHTSQASATAHPLPDDAAAAVITDPPYYDAVPYAYLSDFFYVWLRRTLGAAHTELFREPVVPKDEEIVVDRPHQLSNSTKDISFYERELARAFAECRRVVRPDGVGCIVFASKSTASWEAIIKAVIDAGWIVTGSWPIDTEMETRVAAQGQARLGSSVHIVVRPRETPSGALDEGEVGEWRVVLEELPRRIREWMPRLEGEGVVGADAIFACLGPALEIYSRYSRVERASGEAVLLPEYLEHVWATVSTEALSIIFKDADAGGLEPDARLTAMWLWTIGSGKPEAPTTSGEEEETSDEDDTSSVPARPMRGFALEFDAARKIAQGLGVHLDKCQSFVEVKSETARLLATIERTRYLFGKYSSPETGLAETPRKGKKRAEPTLFQSLEEVKAEIEAAEAEASGKLAASRPGLTVLDRLHQAMLLFSTGRAEALRRFMVDDGVGKDSRFWKLGDSLSKLYPVSSDEKRWLDGVLARKKSFGV